MSDSVKPTVRRLALRYAGTCSVCGIELSRGTEAMWNRNEKTITCLACAPSSGDPESGEAGASAASEGQRRRDKRVEEVRRKHGDHAAAVAEAIAERDHAASWGKGSEGESRLAAFLTREVGDAVIPLHDRLIPGTRGNSTTSPPPACGSSTQTGGSTSPFSVGTVWVVYPKALAKSLRRNGPLSRENMQRVARRLDLSLPHAAS